jgi:hypothetical protein
VCGLEPLVCEHEQRTCSVHEQRTSSLQEVKSKKAVKSEKAVSNTTTATDNCIASVVVKAQTCNTQHASSKWMQDEQVKILESVEEKARLVLVRGQLRKMKPLPKCKLLMNCISEGAVPGFARRRQGGEGSGGASGGEGGGRGHALGGGGQLRWASPPRDSAHRQTSRVPTEGVLCLQRLRGGGVTLCAGGEQAKTAQTGRMSGTKGTLSTHRLDGGTAGGHARLEQDGEEEEEEKLETRLLLFKGRLRKMTPIPMLLLNLRHDCLFEALLRLY